MDRSGLIDQISDLIGDLEPTDDEAVMVAEAINAALASIAATRDVAATMHRVPHDPRRVTGKVEQYVQVGTRWKSTQVAAETTENALTACPDCGRDLIAARDTDAPVRPLLICPRLHGVSIRGVPGLTQFDVVACGYATQEVANA